LTAASLSPKRQDPILHDFLKNSGLRYLFRQYARLKVLKNKDITNSGFLKMIIDAGYGSKPSDNQSITEVCSKLKVINLRLE